MIVSIFLLITLLYLYILSRNMGEKTTIDLSKKYIFIPSLIIGLGLIFVYIQDSNYSYMDEYSKISDRNTKIRENIKLIKRNIPLLEAKIEKNPNNYKDHVILGKSYMLLNEFSMSAKSFKIALDMSSSDSEILLDYIFVLRREDSKKNKRKIILAYEKLVDLDDSNTDNYNLYLNYLFESNDADSAKKILRRIISSPNIKDTSQYKIALANLQKNTKSTYRHTVKLSDNVISHLRKYENIFFILRGGEKAPVAVKRLSKNQLASSITISDENIMIKNSASPPNEVFLLIKTSENKFVSKNMRTIYQSDVFSLSETKTSEININDIMLN